MARTRSLKPSFFANDLLAECEPMARLLFAGLWTLADRDGRLEYRPKRIKGALFPYDNCDVEHLVEQLASRGFLQVYTAGTIRVLSIPTFGEHQRCHPDERSEGFPGPDEAAETIENPGRNEKPGNPTGEPGNFPATCASYPSSYLPSTFNPSASSAPTKPAPRSVSKPQPAVSWEIDAGWRGITDTDRQEWAVAFPGAVIDQELAKATAWLKGNPKKAGRRNWRRFLVGWLQRCQDKGGSNREPSNRQGIGPPPVPAERKRFYRADAAKSLTDDEYRAWRANNRPSAQLKEVS